MNIFDELFPSDHMLSSLNIESIDLSGRFPPQMPSRNSIGGNQMWPDPSIHVKESEFDHNVLSYNSSVPVTNYSFPSTTSFGTEFDLLGYNSFYPPHIGSFDNQGSVEFNSTDFPACFLQENQTNDDILQWVSDTGLDSAVNDDLLKSLVAADLPAMSSQSSVTNNVLTDGFQMHPGSHMTPLVDNKQTVDSSSPILAPKKGLFSQLGLDHLLSKRTGSSTSAKCSNEDQFSSPKRQRMDCYTGDAKSCITAQPERADDSSKVSKKRAKPGESTRPRPKDRQMIQDRLKELREIIPDGAKCSIDSLLDRTIKHMNFMQEVKKYADKQKQVDELKARRDNDNGGVSGSAAWAMEVGGQNPIVVEDLDHSGQMRIEMLCEERGFFLEIADVIRSFGLTILKGVIEARGDKLWAEFIVEANRQVTRMQVLMSLLQHLQETSTNLMGLETIADENNALGDNYHHHPMMSLPIGFSDALR